MIRRAKKEDLDEISIVHSICFPNSFLSVLNNENIFGGNLLSLFYDSYLDDAPELFYVACDDINKKIIGFCMGYYMDNATQMQRFINDNKIWIILQTLWLLCKGNRLIWKKIFSRLMHKPRLTDWTIVNFEYDHIPNAKRGDLLSVCVLPEYRGEGYAQQLMEVFLDALKQNNRDLCLLSVDAKNSRARKYYERNGFEIYRTRGDEGLTYMKLLVDNGIA